MPTLWLTFCNLPSVEKYQWSSIAVNILKVYLLNLSLFKEMNYLWIDHRFNLFSSAWFPGYRFYFTDFLINFLCCEWRLVFLLKQSNLVERSQDIKNEDSPCPIWSLETLLWQSKGRWERRKLLRLMWGKMPPAGCYDSPTESVLTQD